METWYGDIKTLTDDQLLREHYEAAKHVGYWQAKVNINNQNDWERREAVAEQELKRRLQNDWERREAVAQHELKRRLSERE